MRFPHERYIKVLMVDRLPMEEVNQHLFALDLPYPSFEDFFRIEDALTEDAPEDLQVYFRDPRKKLTEQRRRHLAEFIKAHGLGAYYRKTYDFDKLVRARQNESFRVCLEALSLTDLNDEALVTLLNARFTTSWDKDDLQNYKDFFFDVSEMTEDDWHHHLVLSSPEESKLKLQALQYPAQLDYLRWKVGLGTDLDYAGMLRKIRDDAFFLSEEVLRASNPDPSAANVLTSICMRAGDRLEEVDKPDEKTATESLLIEMTQVRALSEDYQASRIHVGPLPPIQTKKAPLLALAGGKEEGKTEEPE